MLLPFLFRLHKQIHPKIHIKNYLETLFVDTHFLQSFSSVLFQFQHYYWSPKFPFILSLFLIVSKLNGQSVTNTAEGGRLNLPVVNRVAKEADAIVEAPLYVKTLRAEVINGHLTYVVGMKVDHLKKKQKSMILHVRMGYFSFISLISRTCRYFMSGRPLGTRVSRLFSKCSSLRLGTYDRLPFSIMRIWLKPRPNLANNDKHDHE